MTTLERVELELYLEYRRTTHERKMYQFQQALAIARGDWRPKTKQN
jgi:hypothetical protein